MKSLLTFILVFPLALISQETRKIKGLVTYNNKPLGNVHVYIENSDVGTYTNANGRYELVVASGQNLIYSFQGLQNQLYETDTLPTDFNVVLSEEVNALEEVTVKEKVPGQKSQKELFDAYNVDKDIVKTKYLLVDKKTAGYAMEIREGDQINFASNNILAVLQSMFAGVKIRQKGQPYNQVLPDDPNAVIYMRGTGSINFTREAIYDVDGTIYVDPPRFLDVTNIKRISRVPALAGTAIYGSIGAGGVFIINTKSANYSPTQEHLRFRAEEKAKKERKITVISRESASRNWPTYLQKLYEANDFDAAVESFRQFEKQYQNVPEFYLDAYEFFSKNMDGLAFADSLITRKYELISKNPETLQALAFLYESQLRYAKMNEISKELLLSEPKRLQGYLNLANSYRSLNELKKSMSIYARYQYLIKEGYLREDKLVFSPIIERELYNLLTLEKKGLTEKISVEKNFSPEHAEYKGTRLLFEWNDTDAEFELQFVNPNGQSYTWEHTLKDNPEEIQREVQFGYSLKEFLLDGSMPGIWKVNIKYRGNADSSRMYLKTTVFKNYNEPSQTKEVSAHKLLLKNVNQELFSIQSTGKIR